MNDVGNYQKVECEATGNAVNDVENDKKVENDEYDQGVMYKTTGNVENDVEIDQEVKCEGVKNVESSEIKNDVDIELENDVKNDEPKSDEINNGEDVDVTTIEREKYVVKMRVENELVRTKPGLDDDEMVHCDVVDGLGVGIVSNLVPGIGNHEQVHDSLIDNPNHKLNYQEMGPTGSECDGPRTLTFMGQGGAGDNKVHHKPVGPSGGITIIVGRGESRKRARTTDLDQ